MLFRGQESRLSQPIGDALFTKTQQKILGLLFGNSEESFHLNEIVRLAGMGKGTIKRELDRMYAAGLLTASRAGNQIRYQANHHCLVFAELRSLVTKTFGITRQLQQALSPLASSVLFAFAYGSIASGEDHIASDIDLMVIGKGLNYARVTDFLLPAEHALERNINPTVYSRAEFRRRLDSQNHFLMRVLEQPRITVIGSLEAIKES